MTIRRYCGKLTKSFLNIFRISIVVFLFIKLTREVWQERIEPRILFNFFFFLVVIKKQDVITVTCLSNLFLLDSRIFGFHLRHQNSKTKELSIILSVYFHDVLKQVKTNIYTKFHSQRALRFVIQCVWISKLLHCATRHLLGGGKICHVGGSEWSGSFDDCTDDYFFQFWRLTVNFRAFGGWLTVI